MPVFLFTDIENSTQLWEQHGEEMGRSLSRHDALVQETLWRHGGRVVKHTEDGVFAVFEEGDPLGCALEIQKKLSQENWGRLGELRVRMALHAGEAQQRGEDYFGSEVNRTARLLSAGWGGQILLTSAAAETCAIPRGASLRDFGVHLLKDLGEPQRIQGLLSPELPTKTFPPLRTLSAHPHNLPAQPTPFLGRKEDLAAVAKHLRNPGCRLLTLTGPGGAGKTRLALQAAALEAEAFAHGVYFVPLAPLPAGELVIYAIADALKFGFFSKDEPKVQLLNYLREKQMLLIADNFEHILEGAGLVAEILQSAPGVKVLATSRERLNLQGEWVHAIAGMRFPEVEGAEVLEDYSAVLLFLQCAERARPGFALKPEERPALGRICRLVEGLPLGLELAAAWVRALSIREIALEMEGHLDFLTSSLRDAPERHRSLRTVFEYSWRLLSEEEKRVFRRLAAFRGGFQREAAEHVAGASLSLLTALADKSLLRRTPSGRYEMLEVLGQYAEEKLGEDPKEKEAVLALHGRYYGEYLHGKEKALEGGRQKEALGEVREELENIRAGWLRAVERKEEGIALYQEGLFLFYDIRCWFKEGEEAFEKAGKAIPGKGKLCGMALAKRAWFLYRLGQYERVLEPAQQSLAIFRHLEAPEQVVFSLSLLADMAYAQGQFEKAEGLVRETLELSRTIGKPSYLAQALNRLGHLALAKGEYETAKTHYEECLALFREGGEQRRVAGYLSNLGNILNALEDFPKGQRLLQESLAIFREIGNPVGIATALNNLGRALAGQGKFEEAKQHYRESLTIRREIGDRYGIAICLEYLGRAACAMGMREEAKGHYRESIRTALEYRAVPLVLEGLVGLADVLQKEGKKERALETISFVLHHPSAHKQTKRTAEEFLTKLESELAPQSLAEALEQGKGKALEEVVSGLLGEEQAQETDASGITHEAL